MSGSALRTVGTAGYPPAPTDRRPSPARSPPRRRDPGSPLVLPYPPPLPERLLERTLRPLRTRLRPPHPLHLVSTRFLSRSHGLAPCIFTFERRTVLPFETLFPFLISGSTTFTFTHTICTYLIPSPQRAESFRVPPSGPTPIIRGYLDLRLQTSTLSRRLPEVVCWSLQGKKTVHYWVGTLPKEGPLG